MNGVIGPSGLVEVCVSWHGHLNYNRNGRELCVEIYLVGLIFSFSDSGLYLQRKFPVFNKHTLIRSVALATAGSGLLYSSIDNDLSKNLILFGDGNL